MNLNMQAYFLVETAQLCFSVILLIVFVSRFQKHDNKMSILF